MEIKNKELIQILKDWEQDFRGAVDITEFNFEQELINFMKENLPSWINDSNTQIEDKILYKEYLKRFLKL